MQTQDCPFCKIANGVIKTPLVYEDHDIIAFDDIAPKAPHHVLIIPKRHIPTVNDLSSSDTLLIGNMLQRAQYIAKERKIDRSGYRLLINCNKGGGQVVFHLHLHLLGGREMGWPPG